MHITRTILFVAILAIVSGLSHANRLYYTTWRQNNYVNSSISYLDVTTNQQGVLFSHRSVIIASAYNTKANLFHFFENTGLDTSNLTTIDMQGNVLQSLPITPTIQCLKYSASKNTLVGATVGKDGRITFVTIDYTTAQVRNMVTVPQNYWGDMIRSCDIDDQTGRLALHQQTNMDAGSTMHLTLWDYRANALVGLYKIALPSYTLFVANIAFANSQLACMVGSSANSTWTVQLGKFSLGGNNDTVTPQMISPAAVPSFIVGFAWNAQTSTFYTLSQGGSLGGAWTIDAYDQKGTRTGSTGIASNILQPRDLVVV
jgi:hypothetical protein